MQLTALRSAGKAVSSAVACFHQQLQHALVSDEWPLLTGRVASASSEDERWDVFLPLFVSDIGEFCIYSSCPVFGDVANGFLIVQGPGNSACHQLTNVAPVRNRH